MNIFAFRPFKGKFNLGDSADIPENEDGTLIGAVKEVKASLTANSKSFTASYQGGKYGFMVGNEFLQIGGGAMVALDYDNPVVTMKTGGTTSYTVVGDDKYVTGMLKGNHLGGSQLSIDGTAIANSNGGSSDIGKYIPPIKLAAGQVVDCTTVDSMYILSEL